jgi:hypothetical protein
VKAAVAQIAVGNFEGQYFLAFVQRELESLYVGCRAISAMLRRRLR